MSDMRPFRLRWKTPTVTDVDAETDLLSYLATMTYNSTLTETAEPPKRN